MKKSWIMGRVLNQTQRAGTDNPSAVLRLLQRVGRGGKVGNSGSGR